MNNSLPTDDDKPYYLCKHNLRCKKCNGYWPDKCRCERNTNVMHRLVLSHPDWPREIHTKWQESPLFTEALARAKLLGITAVVESSNHHTTHE